MKRIQLYLLAALVVIGASQLMLTSCSDDDDDPVVATTTTAGITITANDTITFANTGGTYTFYITAPTDDITAQASETWCTVETTDTASATGITKVTFLITVDANDVVADRSAIVTLLVDGEEAGTIVILQTEADYVELISTAMAQIEPDATGGTYYVTVSTNGTPTFSTTVTWLSATYEAVDDADGQYRFTLTVKTNYNTTSRTATATISVGTASTTVTIIQGAAESSANGVSGTTPEEVFAQLGMGWNLGNHFDSYSSSSYWDNATPTQATFDAVKEAGFSSVRIPVTWMDNMGDSPDYTIDTDYLAEVATVVEYAQAAGLNVIINIHHDGADGAHWLDIATAATDSETNAEIEDQIEKVWTQIAEYFADYDDFLVFEGFNEIHDGSWGWGANRTDGGAQYAVLNGWNQVFVDAVRATGGNNTTRMLGVPGYVSDPDLTVDYFTMPTDNYAENRIMVAAHYYAPTDFTLNNVYSDWGHTGDDTAGWGDEDYLTETLSGLYDTFVASGIPVYLGEIGCTRKSTDASELFRLYYLEYLCRAAHDNLIAPFYWDNNLSSAGSECSGIINHSTGAFYNDGETVATTMITAVTSEDETYTLESIYNNAPE